MNKISLFFFLLVSLAFGQKAERSQLILPPKQIVQINYPLYPGFNVKIWNKSKFDLGVSAREQKTDSLVKGFGLDSGSSAVLEVNKGLYLQFENRYLAPLKVEYTLQKGVEGKKKSTKPLTPQRAFYLENNTAQSIPLRIPGVMNPNLSPFSRSGVDLPNGQKIFLDLNGKQILLLTVTDSIPHGARIDVATLIEKALNNP
ncbi:MAG: hypothetical protein ISQ98_02690 [Flavobacteriaceae bacterium]|nr:hypothetical protein [Flavobacteriaceae bacterium]